MNRPVASGAQQRLRHRACFEVGMNHIHFQKSTQKQREGFLDFPPEDDSRCEADLDQKRVFDY